MKKSPVLIAVLLLLCVAANLGLDQWTKVIARQELIGKDPIVLLGGFFTIVYAENTGSFLGAFANLDQPFKDILLIWVPLAATLAAIGWMVATRKLSLGERFTLACMIGGGMANLIDRALYGKVTDFLHFNFGLFRTGILNVADLSLTFGAVVLFILLWHKDRRQKALDKKNDGEPSSPPPQ